MANEIEQIYIDGTTYPVADATARAKLESIDDTVVKYVNDQNELGDILEINLAGNSSTATEMSYDGFYIFGIYGSAHLFSIYVNDIRVSYTVSGNSTTGITNTATIPFKKGDKIYRTGPVSSAYRTEYVRYYDKRDYSQRE